VLLGTLVTGNTYRNPSLLAKIITTLDVISQGRAVLGIGTGWFELEHDQLGFEFGTFAERFAKLGEALQILMPMIAGEHVTFAGEHYRTEGAFAVPRIRDHIPLMIGGTGEKKTFGLAARYFDHLNVIASFDELPNKVEALKVRCAEVDRDPSSLETSVLLTAVPDPSFTEDRVPAAMRGRMVVGSPDQIAEAVKNHVVDVGINGVIVNLPAYRPGSITELGAALRPVVGR
jgi:alkanesulfonate monooxygenase SsuD/methylene tetrahydromethanopterin reductase-like flavin-dependent oxidoreductase (luciferase family)